jgi:hypothetical protein
MCRPRWVHSRRIDGLHRKWGIAVEAIVVLHGRLVLRMAIRNSIMPVRIMVLKRLLVVVVLVVHLELAHIERQLNDLMQGIRAIVGASVLDVRSGSQGEHLRQRRGV